MIKSSCKIAKRSILIYNINLVWFKMSSHDLDKARTNYNLRAEWETTSHTTNNKLNKMPLF